MISLLIAFAVLIVGHLIYGRITDRIFAADDRQTPAIAVNDGVDCVPMKTWKAFLVQLLNIAGTGPIFGALMGAVFGPVVFLCIVFGSILGGAVHDYMSGMISERHGGASNVVYEISTGVLGAFGGMLAIAGVVICPITSGDTAFRSARLILAETFHLNQKKIRNRLIVTIPLLIVGGLLTWYAIADDKGFAIIWRYFSWSNQTLATISLWVATTYLVKAGKHRFGSLLTALPATFMSAVCMTYILTASEGFRVSTTIAVPVGVGFASALLVAYCMLWTRSQTQRRSKVQ